MLWNELRQLSRSRKICRDLNLESELNDTEMLKNIYLTTVGMIGLTQSQPISCDMFFEKMGEIILELAENGKISSTKTLALVNQYSERETRLILGRTAVCLLERYGFILGGPKIS